MTGESVRRAIRTTLVAALVIWLPGLLGWLNAVTSWAKSEGATPFPDAHGLAYLGVSAIVGGVIGLVQWLINTIEDGIGRGFLRDVPPRVGRGEGGYFRLVSTTWPVTIDGTFYGPSRDRTLPGKARIRARRLRR